MSRETGEKLQENQATRKNLTGADHVCMIDYKRFKGCLIPHRCWPKTLLCYIRDYSTEKSCFFINCTVP